MIETDWNRERLRRNGLRGDLFGSAAQKQGGCLGEAAAVAAGEETGLPAAAGPAFLQKAGAEGRGSAFRGADQGDVRTQKTGDRVFDDVIMGASEQQRLRTGVPGGLKIAGDRVTDQRDPPKNSGRSR